MENDFIRKIGVVRKKFMWNGCDVKMCFTSEFRLVENVIQLNIGIM